MSGTTPLVLKPRGYRKDRPLLVCISDIHLTDTLGGPPVPWDQTFERFWTRIEGARGDEPADLCIIGDFIDLVRSPTWLATEHRPYHSPNPGQAAVVDRIVAATIARERGFFDAIRTRVQQGLLRVHLVLGNHDRLLGTAPHARRLLWHALTGEDRDITIPTERIFGRHDTLVHHGHSGDFICSDPDGEAPVSDIFGLELIVRFPDALRARIDEDLPHLDDIDDVRPIYAVPAWIRQISGGRRGLMRPVSETWALLVEEFVDGDAFRDWKRRQRRVAGVDPGLQLERILRLSTGKVMAKTSDKRLTRAFKVLQHLFDGRFAERAAHRLATPQSKGLRYVINGHSHFPSMVPLGHIGGKPACYFNSGTWRQVHQIGTHVPGRPTFLPYHAMSYIVFFPGEDALGRDVEWWTGAMVARSDAHPD